MPLEEIHLVAYEQRKGRTEKVVTVVKWEGHLNRLTESTSVMRRPC